MTMFLLLFIAVLGMFSLVIVVLMRYVLLVVTVENRSMAPTLESGDRVLMARHWPARWLRKGHIVLIAAPTGLPLFAATPYIKRIVALGGEPLPEDLSRPFEADTFSHQQTSHNQNHLHLRYIPQNHLFVCGDNLAYSLDSRVWGPVSLKRVLGVVLMKLPSKSPSSQSTDARGVDR